MGLADFFLKEIQIKHLRETETNNREITAWSLELILSCNERPCFVTFHYCASMKNI